MAYQTLYRTYRPQRFADVVGQEHVTRTLQNAIAGDKLAHAYLFCGPRGTGKTTAARILAKALNCAALDPSTVDDVSSIEPCGECPSCVDIGRGVSFDVYEVDAATHRGIDDIRTISERAQQAASDPSRRSVFIIDEVHQLSRDGASAFLKTLEEPPPNVVFVLATTDPDKMIPTILSRCQRFDFRPVATGALARRLAWVCEQEGIDANDAALEALARRAKGGVRDALSALEQARALRDDAIGLEDVAELFGGVDTTDLAAVVDAVVGDDVAAALRTVDALVNRGIDVRAFTRDLAAYTRGVFLVASAPDARDLVDAGDDEYAAMREQAQQLGPGRATRLLTLLGQCLSRMPQALQPRIELETALVQAIRVDVDPSVGALAQRLDRLEKQLAGGAAVAAAPTPGAAAPRAAAPRVAAPAAAPAAPAPSVAPQPAASPSADVTPPTAPPSAATPSPAPAPASVATAADVTVADVADVESRWPAVLAHVRDTSRRLGAYFLDSVPVALDDDVLTVRFVHSFNRDNAVADQARPPFDEACTAVFGRTFRLVGTAPGDDDPSGRPAATGRRAAAPRTAVQSVPQPLPAVPAVGSGDAGDSADGAPDGPAPAADRIGADAATPTETPTDAATDADDDDYDVLFDAPPDGTVVAEGAAPRAVELLSSELGAEVVEERPVRRPRKR